MICCGATRRGVARRYTVSRCPLNGAAIRCVNLIIIAQTRPGKNHAQGFDLRKRYTVSNPLTKDAGST